MPTVPTTKTVLKIEMGGSVTSFRYPHLMQGRQPTYEMPPPSTIYGHICSAAGNWVDLATLEFGYHFTHEGKFVDFKEHLHFGDPIQPFPFDRELLFNPRLTLYVTPASLLDAFRHPHFAVVLGRSQDLMTYRSVRVVRLQRAERAYFEHTLLPLYMGPRLQGAMITVTMARYVDPRRRPAWGTYTLLRDAAIWPPLPESSSSDLDEGEGWLFEGDDQTVDLWVDPESPNHRKATDLKRAIWFHRFTDEED
jgi:CRISPR-associated protein Cas5t